MFDSIWLDIAIGLITVFLVFSLITSGAREMFAVVLAARSKNLWNQLSMLLDNRPTNERPDNAGSKRRAAVAGRGDQLTGLAKLGAVGHRVLNKLKRWFRQAEAQTTDVVTAAEAKAAGVLTQVEEDRTAIADLDVGDIVKLLKQGKMPAWKALYAHPFIRNLDLTNAAAVKTRLSHIPPRDFSRAVIDLFLTAGEDPDLVFGELQAGLTKAHVAAPTEAQVTAAKEAVMRVPRPEKDPAALATALDGAFSDLDTAVAGLDDDQRKVVAPLVAAARESCGRYCAAEKDFQKIENGINALLPANNALRRVARQLVGEADEKLHALRDSVSDWFDSHMAALSHSYRTRTRIWTFVIGLAVAISFNVDSIGVSYELYRDENTRSALVSLGDQLVEDLDLDTQKGACGPEEAPAADADAREVITSQRECIAERAGQIAATGLPVGWAGFGDFPWYQRLGGWLITGFALSFGSTFWYDLLKRLTGLRRKDEK